MRFILAAALLALSASPAFCGAWTLKQGETQTFVTSTFTYGDHGYDASGKLITVSDYQKFALSAVLEYGLRPWLTAVVRGEMTEERIDDPLLGPDLIEPAPKNFASVGGGARIRLYQGPSWVASTEITVLSGGYATTGLTNPNEGPALEVRALAGHARTVVGKNVFFDGQLAYRKRFDTDESDEVKLDLTVGAQVLPKWLVLGQTFSTLAVDGEQSYHKVSASVVRTVTKRLRVQVGGVATVAGKNAVQELGGYVGFWWSLPPPDSTRSSDLVASVPD